MRNLKNWSAHTAIHTDASVGLHMPLCTASAVLILPGRPRLMDSAHHFPKLCMRPRSPAPLPQHRCTLTAVSWVQPQYFEGQIALLSSSKYPHKSDIFNSLWKY